MPQRTSATASRRKLASNRRSEEKTATKRPGGRIPRAGGMARDAVSRIKNLSPLRPKLAIILGSGFHHVLEEMEVDARVSYSQIPGFPAPGVKGHVGEFLAGWVGGTPAYVLSGRAHFYEGHSMQTVTFAVRTLAALGIPALLLTNAAGGINRRFRPGDFMALSDHINLTGDNPLCGEIGEGLNRFVDLSEAYDPSLQKLLKQAARQAGVRLHSGVYLAVRGPSYETPAEIRAFERLGADAVGMSTVPETIVARQLGLCVAGVSCITNLAAGRGGKTLSHTEVLETAVRVKREAAQLISNFARIHGRSK